MAKKQGAWVERNWWATNELCGKDIKKYIVRLLKLDERLRGLRSGVVSSDTQTRTQDFHSLGLRTNPHLTSVEEYFKNSCGAMFEKYVHSGWL